MIKREEIKYRVDNVYKEKGVTLLIYIDSRAARRELNEKFGFYNWKFAYTVNDDKSVHGILSLRNKENADEWLEFHDVGYCSNEFTKEPLKDAVSDATKRCAVQVGIGEELYDAPFLYVEWAGLKVVGDKVKGLNEDSVKIIEGRITKWYDSIGKILNS